MIITLKNQKNMAYASDIEMSTATFLFGYNIRAYYQEYCKFGLINEFNQSLPLKNNIDKDIINLLFINKNHFQLLLQTNYKNMN